MAKTLDKLQECGLLPSEITLRTRQSLPQLSASSTPKITGKLSLAISSFKTRNPLHYPLIWKGESAADVGLRNKRHPIIVVPSCTRAIFELPHPDPQRKLNVLAASEEKVEEKVAATIRTHKRLEFTEKRLRMRDIEISTHQHYLNTLKLSAADPAPSTPLDFRYDCSGGILGEVLFEAEENVHPGKSEVLEIVNRLGIKGRWKPGFEHLNNNTLQEQDDGVKSQSRKAKRSSDRVGLSRSCTKRRKTMRVYSDESEDDENNETIPQRQTRFSRSSKTLVLSEEGPRQQQLDAFDIQGDNSKVLDKGQRFRFNLNEYTEKRVVLEKGVGAGSPSEVKSEVYNEPVTASSKAELNCNLGPSGYLIKTEGNWTGTQQRFKIKLRQSRPRSAASHVAPSRENASEGGRRSVRAQNMSAFGIAVPVEALASADFECCDEMSAILDERIF